MDNDKSSWKCGFCGRDYLHVWDLVSGGAIMICDACADSLHEIVERSQDKPLPQNEKEPRDGDLFARCSFCKELRKGSEKVIGSNRVPGVMVDPVMCYTCIGLAAESFIEKGIPLGQPDSWYRPLRDVLKEWLFPAGAKTRITPEDLAALTDKLAAASPAKHVELDAIPFPVGDPWRPRVVRRFFAQALLPLLHELDKAIALDHAIALGEAWVVAEAARRA